MTGGAGLSASTSAWAESPPSPPSEQAERRTGAELAAAAVRGELAPGQADRILARLLIRMARDCDALAAALLARTHPFQPHPDGPVEVSGCAADSEHGGMLVCCEPADAAVHQTPDVVLGRDGDET